MGSFWANFPGYDLGFRTVLVAPGWPVIHETGSRWLTIHKALVLCGRVELLGWHGISFDPHINLL